MSEESTNWLNLYENMNQGKVDYNSNFYMVDTTSQEGSGDVKLVTPTQAQVDQAKAQLKRKISVARNLFPKRPRKSGKKTQTGGKRAAKKTKRTVKQSQRGGKKGVRRGKKPVKRLVKRGRPKKRQRK